MTLSWKYRLSSNSVIAYNSSISHIFSLPGREHATKPMKLQHLFKLRNAYFSGQCSPLVSSEKTLVFKGFRWVCRNGLDFTVSCRGVWEYLLKSCVSKVDKKVAIVSINVCDIWLPFIWHLLLLAMPVTPKTVEINFILHLHWFGEVWTVSSPF